MSQSRVNVYVDGLNLYFGIRYQLRRPDLLWIDLVGVIKDQVHPPNILNRIKYFNTTPSDNSRKTARHRKWLKILDSLSFPVESYEGRYTFPQWECSWCKKPLICKSCDVSFSKPIEKRTDVNIAVHLICDAFADDYDAAYIISRDADIIPALQALQRTHNNKEIIVIFPPGHPLHEIKQYCSETRHLRTRHFIPHQLNDPFETPDGLKLYKPKKWSEN